MIKNPFNCINYILGAVIIALSVVCYYYKNLYEDTYKNYVVEMVSKKQLSLSLESQNKEIEKLKIESIEFKSKYQQVIENESNKVINSYSKYNVESCNDLLELIENFK